MLATALSILSSGLQIVLKALGMVHDAQERQTGIQTQLNADLTASNQEAVDAQKDAAVVDDLSRQQLIDKLRGPEAGS